MVAKMNKSKATIEYKGLEFKEFYTFSEFLKKYSEAKKTYSADSISIVVTDGSQVVAEDVFMQAVLPLGISLVSLGSPLQTGRFIAWQQLNLATPQPVPEPEVAEEAPIDSNRQSKEKLTTVKDKDKKKK